MGFFTFRKVLIYLIWASPSPYFPYHNDYAPVSSNMACWIRDHLSVILLRKPPIRYLRWYWVRLPCYLGLLEKVLYGKIKQPHFSRGILEGSAPNFPKELSWQEAYQKWLNLIDGGSALAWPRSHAKRVPGIPRIPGMRRSFKIWAQMGIWCREESPHIWVQLVFIFRGCFQLWPAKFLRRCSELVGFVVSKQTPTFRIPVGGSHES